MRTFPFVCILGIIIHHSNPGLASENITAKALAGVTVLPYSGYAITLEHVLDPVWATSFAYVRGYGIFMAEESESSEFSLGVKRKSTNLYAGGRLSYRTYKRNIDYWDFNNAPALIEDQVRSNALNLDFALGHQWAFGKWVVDCEWAGLSLALAGKKVEKSYRNKEIAEENHRDLFATVQPIIFRVQAGYAL